MKRTLPLPAHLSETNPHSPGEAGYLEWMQNRSARLSRPVVIVSPQPDGSAQGWVMPEGTLSAMAGWLRKPGSYWRYLDEFPDGEAGSSADAATIAALRRELQTAKNALAEAAAKLNKIHDLSAP